MNQKDHIAFWILIILILGLRNMIMFIIHNSADYLKDEPEDIQFTIKAEKELL